MKRVARRGLAIGTQTGAAPALAVTTDALNRVTDDGVNTYSWNATNVLTARTPKASGVAATTFSYAWHGAYRQVRLESAQTPTGLYNFFYDPLNRLVGYRPNLNGGGLDDRYYDGADMVLQFRRLNAGNQWVRFVYGPGADQPLAMEVYPVAAAPTPGSGQVFYYHADGEGSIRLLTDANAQVANRYDYDSFGKPLTVVEAVAQPYTWKAREYIAGAGLYYNRARFYDPQLGRFTTEDPLGYGGGDTNLYVLAWNNPRRWNDPSGLGAIEYGGFAGNALKSTAKLAAVACGVTLALSTLAALLSGDAENRVVGVTASNIPCLVVAVTMAAPDEDQGDQITPLPPLPLPAPVQCTKATSFHLKRAGILGREHEFKDEYQATPNSRFDICACKDGSIQIGPVGTCPTNGPKEITHATWK